jgi:hypothetical protein
MLRVRVSEVCGVIGSLRVPVWLLTAGTGYLVDHDM